MAISPTRLVVIPRAEVEIVWDVDYTTLHELSSEDLEYGFGTRQYASALVREATWDDARRLLAREEEVIDRVESIASDESEFDRLAHEEEGEFLIDDPNEGFVPAPDLGMFAACVGLCAAGCATSASCRGHPSNHAWSDHPVIQLVADAARARIIEEIARSADCGLVSADGGGLILWAQSIAEIVTFTQMLLDRAAEFDAIALPDTLRMARLHTGLQSLPPEQESLF
jgi:hypothetical protein